jgi:hypothetical protein
MSGLDKPPPAPWQRRRPGVSETSIPLRISEPDGIPAGLPPQVRPPPDRAHLPGASVALCLFVAYGPGGGYADLAVAGAGLRRVWAGSGLPAPFVTAHWGATIEACWSLSEPLPEKQRQDCARRLPELWAKFVLERAAEEARAGYCERLTPRTTRAPPWGGGARFLNNPGANRRK